MSLTLTLAIDNDASNNETMVVIATITNGRSDPASNLRLVHWGSPTLRPRSLAIDGQQVEQLGFFGSIYGGDVPTVPASGSVHVALSCVIHAPTDSANLGRILAILRDGDGTATYATLDVQRKTEETAHG